MSIIQSLQQATAEAVQALYGQMPTPEQLQFQKTRSEFEGQWTLVAFPLLKISRKNPEATAQEIGAYLQEHCSLVEGIQIVKGFLNLSIAPAAWIEDFNAIRSDKTFGHKQATADAPFVMVEYSSPNTNKPLHLGHVRNAQGRFIGVLFLEDILEELVGEVNDAMQREEHQRRD